MKSKLFVTAALLALVSSAAALTEESLRFGPFGEVAIYYDSLPVSRVVLFISGDGGWNKGVVDMARIAAGEGALVAGIDIRTYLAALSTLKEPCLYPAGDLEELSQHIQSKYHFEAYVPPVLLGYSSGATMVYAILVQAPPNTFRGGVSLGFCPDLITGKPLCRGSGLEWEAGKRPGEYIFRPSRTIEVPWIALQGAIDKVCDPASTAAFVGHVNHGEIITLPRVGHGFAVFSNWVPQFKKALERAFSEEARETELPGPEFLRSLPLVEVPSSKSPGRILAVHITGSGGWGVTDKGLSEGLAARGVPVVAWNSFKYFWTRRTPESAAEDLARILRYYLRAWDKTEAVVIGYSFGADALPFLYNRLPPDLRGKIRLVALLGPSDSANFVLGLRDFLGAGKRKDEVPTMPEIEKIKNAVVLCFYGIEDPANLCGRLSAKGIRSIAVRSGHRFGRNFRTIVDVLLAEIARAS